MKRLKQADLRRSIATFIENRCYLNDKCFKCCSLLVVGSPQCCSSEHHSGGGPVQGKLNTSPFTNSTLHLKLPLWTYVFPASLFILLVVLCYRLLNGTSASPSSRPPNPLTQSQRVAAVALLVTLFHVFGRNFLQAVEVV